MAEVVWLGLGAYGAIGVLIALVLLAGAIKRFDASAAAAPLGVKLLLLPGLAALWPLLLRRAMGWRPKEDRA